MDSIYTPKSSQFTRSAWSSMGDNYCSPSMGILSTSSKNDMSCKTPWVIVFLMVAALIVFIIWIILKYSKSTIGVIKRDIDCVIKNTIPQPTYTPVSYATPMNLPATVLHPSYDTINQGSVLQGSSETIRMCQAQAKAAIFMFTMENCMWCTSTKPQFATAAQYLNLDVYEVCKDNLDEQDMPQGYPYIFLLKPDGRRISYNGARCARDIVSFVENELGSSYTIPTYKNLSSC